MADLRTLNSSLYPWARWLYNVGNNYDGRLVVTSARRSIASQARLYADYQAGKTVIPAAPPGRSLHQTGWAWDMARMGIDPLTDPLLPWLGAWWEYDGGRWGGVRDPVHFQIKI